jgi:hypothetical protein
VIGARANYVVKAYETPAVQHMKALQFWRAAVARFPQASDGTKQELVATLISLCGDYLEDPDVEIEQAISDEARELAKVALSQMDIDHATQIYRDDLVEAISKNVSADGAASQRVLRFSNLVTDAIYREHADALRRTIRHQRLESLSNELRVAKGIQERLVTKEVPTV